MKYTGNYNLKKPEGTDVVNIDDLNGNMDILDAEVAKKVDKVSGKGLSTNDYTNEEKNKLSGIQSGAQVNTVTSVAGKTGAVVVSKSDVGLSNVDNVKQASKTEFDSHVGSKSVHGLNNSPIALGEGATATNNSSVALGKRATATNNSSVALGNYTESTGASSIAIGSGATAGWPGSVALGSSATANGSYSVALGSSATADGNCSVALGRLAESHNIFEGVLGGSSVDSTNKWIVPGSFTVNGTKNFEIPHPKPEKSATHVIRHGAVESPTAGDTLYRWQITANKDNDTALIDLPDYFVYLNKNVQIFVTPQGHFGNGYGSLNRETEQLEIHCQTAGKYNVLAIGTRNDNHQSVQDWDIKGVEREIGESWTGETYVFNIDEIMEVEEIKEVI